MSRDLKFTRWLRVKSTSANVDHLILPAFTSYQLVVLLISQQPRIGGVVVTNWSSGPPAIFAADHLRF